ncbi:MAG: hypothetical protein GWN87_26550, partial [Desulfuromonadales bacterium]|nr:hypothetical protein [Desulfuromonadales bacterium]NIS43305.1 hypothetical protein [Desulfuromonadales bacterium]
MDSSDAQIADLYEPAAPKDRENLFAGNRCSRGSLFCWLILGGAALGVVGLYWLSRQNYLLFHSLVEIFSVVVSFTVFSIGWHAQKIHRNNVFLVFAVAFLMIGSLDFLHTLSYKGMNVFPGHGANLATQLW